MLRSLGRLLDLPGIRAGLEQLVAPTLDNPLKYLVRSARAGTTNKKPSWCVLGDGFEDPAGST